MPRGEDLGALAGQDEDQETEEQEGDKSVDTLQQEANAALESFRETHSDQQQQFIADAFVMTGEIPTGEDFGITEEQATAVQAGFIATMERDVFSQYGLTHDLWMEHVDDNDLPAFRKAAMKGDWSVFHQHAEQCAKLRKELGI